MPGCPTAHDRIDLVITWVDGTDPAWRRKRNHYAPSAHAARKANVEGRFRDHGELRYLLRSIERFWPFSGNIYLVTDQQFPAYLHADRGLICIDHQQILAPQYLPTFASPAIESALHTIPGLAEHFVVFNDDIFLTRPVTVADFFGTQGRRIYLTDIPSPQTVTPDLLGGHYATALAAQWIRATYGQNSPSFLPAHTPLGMVRSWLQALEAQHPAMFHATRQARFRDLTTQAIASNLYPWDCAARGRADCAADPSLYLDAQAIEDGSAAPLLQQALGNKLCVCMQDTMDNRSDTAQFTRNLNAFCTALFPTPSRWERAEQAPKQTPTPAPAPSAGASAAADRHRTRHSPA